MAYVHTSLYTIHTHIFTYTNAHIYFSTYTLGTQLAGTILSTFYMLTQFNSNNLLKGWAMKDPTPSCFRILWLVWLYLGTVG